MSAMLPKLSTEQAAVLQQIAAWFKDKSLPYLTVGGYAGTGKTTLIAYLRQGLVEYDDKLRVAFCSYTGKASRGLAATLRAHEVVLAQDSVGTIHSLLYHPQETVDGLSWRPKTRIDSDLIIVDEASMVDEGLWRDLLTHQIPVLAVGDHGQLPPVGSEFNLMADPSVRLEKIWRQADNSPILQLATLARETGRIPIGQYGLGVAKFDRTDSLTGTAVEALLEGWNEELLVLCGFNATRTRLNQAIRTHLGYETVDPTVNDRVVALRNNRTGGVYNGLTGRITEIAPAGNEWWELGVRLDGEPQLYHGFAWRAQFGAGETQRPAQAPDGKPGDLFDFGYALTVHKAQGTQAPGVLLFEERSQHMDDATWRRWLYTAVTRAQERLTIIGN